jgi:hypothetical protein
MTDTDITTIRILGPFNTGTNLLVKMIEHNITPVLTVLGPDNMKIWKHEIEFAVLNEHIAKEKSTLFICLYRPVASWIESVKKSPYDIEWDQNDKSTCSMLGVSYSSIFHLYQKYYRNYTNLMQQHNNVISLEYYKIIIPDSAGSYINRKLGKFGLEIVSLDHLHTVLHRPSKAHGNSVQNCDEAIKKYKDLKSRDVDYTPYTDTDLIRFFEEVTLAQQTCNPSPPVFVDPSPTANTSPPALASILRRTNNGSRTLLIAFGGMAMSLGGILPFEFKKTLDDHFPDIDSIFFIDRHQKWYHKGIEGISTNIEETVGYLSAIVGKYESVCCLGTSAGGYAALLFGSILNVRTVVAFVPQTLVDFDGMDGSYRNLKHVINHKTKYVIHGDLSVMDYNDNHHISQCENIESFTNVQVIRNSSLDLKQWRSSGSLVRIIVDALGN